mgnify:CR=1 FL=1
MTASGIHKLLFGLVLVFSHAVKGEPFEVAVTHFPPQFVVGTDGKISGPLVDVLAQTLDEIGVPYYFESYPPKRLLRNLIDGESQIALGIKTATSDGLTHAAYGTRPVHRVELRILSLSTTKIPVEFFGLIGETVGLIRGYEYGSRRALLTKSKATTIVDINSHRAALEMLMKGRIRFLLDYKQPIESIITPAQLTAIDHLTIQEIDMFFIVSKTVKDANGLLQSMEKAYFGDDS